MRIAVLGGGLQGASIALALAERGARVDLFEKRAACMSQASRQNEGKIHFGFVFANDASLASSRLMMDGARVFEPLVRRWLGARADALCPSAPFHYFVHRDSLVTPDELQRRYNAISAYARETGARCYGADPAAPTRQLSDAQRDVFADGRTIQAVFATPEIALDPFVLSDLFVAALTNEPAIAVHLNCAATAISPRFNECVVHIDGPGGPAQCAYDHVVNATWEDLLALDVSAGAPLPARPWSWRIKHFLRVEDPGATLPTATIVLGPFGDIVRYPDGAAMLSWYPVGRRGMSGALKPPPWPLDLAGAGADETRAGILAGLSRIAPAVAALPAAASHRARVHGGIIYAAGDTDVDKRDSGLHDRSNVGPLSRGRYHSVNTGKWTLAPMFAERLAAQLMSGQ